MVGQFIAKCGTSFTEWTEGDELKLRDMLARRKAAGYRRASRDVSAQKIALGDISPNPKTIIASIYAIVALNGEISRKELIREMTTTVFPGQSPKPYDKKWCQGWIAGAIRNGYLRIVTDGQSTVADSIAQTPVRVRASALSGSEA